MIFNFFKGCFFAIIFIFVLFCILAVSAFLGFHIKQFFHLSDQVGLFISFIFLFVISFGVTFVIQDM
jgi:hypothetical protein